VYKILFFVAIFTIGSLKAQIVTTVAGNGTQGYSGDGGPALNAQLGNMLNSYPAFDRLGNMYIAQIADHTIRKVDVNGIITTIAGTGTIGYSGDGGLAINAQLKYPAAMAVDTNNNIFFVDQGYKIIRKITPAGMISTVSGPPTFNCGLGDGGPLSNAQFQLIGALVFDKNNNLYITDNDCNTIRKVNGAGIITTVAGNGFTGSTGDGGLAINASLYSPGIVAIDNAGNIYIPQIGGNSIRKVSTNGIITTIVGTGVGGHTGDGGPALQAQLFLPGGVVIDSSGNIFVAEFLHYIRKINTSGIITTYAGDGGSNCNNGDGGPAISATLDFVGGLMSMHKEQIYLINFCNAVIKKISDCPSPYITKQPQDISICNVGNIMFTINANNAISYQWQVNTSGTWNNIANNSTYLGVHNDTLLITGANNTMHNYQYRCVVVNTCDSLISNTAYLYVTTPDTPSVVITSSLNAACKNIPISFTASITNGGSLPLYQWEKNGIVVASNTNSYIDSNLLNGDVVKCRLISSIGCVTTNPVYSNILTSVIYSLPIVALNHSNVICTGVPRILDAGNHVSYLWNTGATTPVLQVNSTGTYSVIVKNANGCVGKDTTIITTIATIPSNFLKKDTAICIYNNIEVKPNQVFQNYLWSTGSTTSSITVNNPGLYSLKVKNNSGCEGVDSISVTLKDCVKGFYMPTAFTPNKDGVNDFIKPILGGIVKQYSFSILNRWGNMVFKTSNHLEAWNGIFKGIPQPMGNFIWTCTYQLEGQNIEQKKGTLLLIK
jgi:gliding motility-associated-like protein